MDPLGKTLEGSLLELALRVSRLEARVGYDPEAPLASFGRGADDDPDLGGAERCSCDEAVALRRRVAQLEHKLRLLEPIGPRER